MLQKWAAADLLFRQTRPAALKSQYFGDIYDYRKFGLIRALQVEAQLQVLVAWMLTPNDQRRDGELRSYLREPRVEQWTILGIPLEASGCSKRPLSKAAVSEGPRRTLCNTLRA